MYPSIWKLSHVISIHQGDRSLLSNYRLISLISCVGKVFERIIFKKVYNHLIVNNLVYQYQSGFLPKHSIYHLLEIYQYNVYTFEDKQFACVVFCDFYKDCDKVWHERWDCDRLNAFVQKLFENKQQYTIMVHHLLKRLKLEYHKGLFLEYI